jgi:P3 major capsid protein
MALFQRSAPAGGNGASQGASPLQMAMAARQQNDMIRHMILRGGSLDGKSWSPAAVNMWQALNPGVPATIAPGTVMTAYLRNVGLIKKLWLQFKATITAGASTTQTLGKLGIDAFVSNVTVYDLANNTRVNTTGWHLRAVANAKRRRTFGASYTTDMATIMGYGAVNNRVNYAAATIAANGTSELDLILEVPFAYTDRDLRGALYADTTQASVLVQVTLNPNMFVTSTADASQALYQSGGTDLATLSAVSWQIYQNYLDQLPRLANGVPLLPPDDIATAYVLTNTVSALPVANQDNTTAFINARRFQSLVVGYDNAGTLNANGSDINSIAITSANFTNILKTDGKTLHLMARDHIGSDMPQGFYYLDFRDRPIDTDQYGNMQIVINPSSVGGSTALFLFGWEAFGKIGQINQGGSIPSGA